MLKIWLMETRPQYLLLSVILAFLGTCMAWYYQDVLHLGYALLAGFGLVLTHISVNTLNDYFDFKSGVDLRTDITPFSGGSGILKAGLLKPNQVLWTGIITLLLAAPVGIYFVIAQGWLLLPLLIVAALCVVLYTPVILNHKWPEWSAGLGLGMLPVLGMYFAQTGFYSWLAFFGSVPSFVLVHNLLLLNEFPDVEADSFAGRKTLPITMGKTKAAKFFTAMTVLLYLWIAGCVAAGVAPAWTLLAFLTLPFSVMAVRGSFQHDQRDKLIAAMKNNVLVVLATQFLLAVGYLVAAVT
ncbi:MAG TPA: prenyltransferase [Deltaproteobacteria bacterium]|nr:prenyltransferase [Deltaproteobacteria bacterium]